MNYLPTCTSRLVVQHPCQVSFKSMQRCRRSWEDRLKCVKSVKDHNSAEICWTWITSPHALLHLWHNICTKFHSNPRKDEEGVEKKNVDGTEWRTKQTLNAPLPFYGGGIKSYGTMWKVLSQGIHMCIRKAIYLLVRKLWPRLNNLSINDTWKQTLYFNILQLICTYIGIGSACRYKRHFNNTAFIKARVAQSVEHQPTNRKFVGSSPTVGKNLYFVAFDTLSMGSVELQGAHQKRQNTKGKILAHSWADM